MKSHDLKSSLEDELAANPDDLATHAAYADLLSEEGDPRGELIQVQIALEDPQLAPEERQELLVRERSLLIRHQREWLGELAPFFLDIDASEMQPLGTFRFRRGWLDQLRISWLPLRLARVLREAPQARLLRDLTIESAHEEEDVWPTPEDGAPENDPQPGFWPLVGSPNLVNLRRLQIGIDDGEDWRHYSCHVVASVMPLLVRSCPALEELHIFADGYRIADVLGSPTLKHLRILQMHHASAVVRLDILANNPACQHLTHLLIHPHAMAWYRNQEEDEAAGFRKEQGYLPLTVVRPVLYSPLLSRLTHLRLRVSSMGDEGCQEIVASGILKRLKVLDLRHGCVTDQGARILADSPDLKRLELLDLGYHALSEEGVRLLQGQGIATFLEEQRRPGGQEGNDYLMEGEFE